MEAEEAQLKLQKQRETRRRRILSNPNARMNKLLNRCDDTPSLSATAAAAAAECPAEDPPDELIERPLPQAPAPPSSLLARLVCCVRGGPAVRSVAAACCGLLLVATLSGGWSYLLLWTLLLEVPVLAWLVLRGRQAGTAAAAPPRWLAVLSLPLSLVHPSLPHWLQTACLAILLACSVLADILFMLFVVIATCSVLSLRKSFTM